jgi:hypothetical protein
MYMDNDCQMDDYFHPSNNHSSTLVIFIPSLAFFEAIVFRSLLRTLKAVYFWTTCE